MQQLFHPSSLGVIQSLLKLIKYDLVDSLDLLISLRIGQSGISVRNSKVAAVFPEGHTIKLKVVVRDVGMRNSEAWNDVSSDEFLCIHVPDVGQRLSFDPFGEIICADHQVLLVSCCFQEGADNIQTSLSERPRTRKGVKDSSRLVDI